VGRYSFFSTFFIIVGSCTYAFSFFDTTVYANGNRNVSDVNNFSFSSESGIDSSIFIDEQKSQFSVNKQDKNDDSETAETKSENSEINDLTKIYLDSFQNESFYKENIDGGKKISVRKGGEFGGGGASGGWDPKPKPKQPEKEKPKPKPNTGGSSRPAPPPVINNYYTHIVEGKDFSADINNLYNTINRVIDFVNGLSSNFDNYQNYANAERAKLFGNFDIANGNAIIGIDRANDAYSRASRAWSDALDAFNRTSDNRSEIEKLKKTINESGNKVSKIDNRVTSNSSKIADVERKLIVGENAYTIATTNSQMIGNTSESLRKLTEDLTNRINQNWMVQNNFKNANKNSREISELKEDLTRIKRGIDSSTTGVITDVGIIAAIVGLHDTWKSQDYKKGVMLGDGDAVKLIKTQTGLIVDGLKNIVNVLDDIDVNFWKKYRDLDTNYRVWLKQLLNSYFDLFNEKSTMSVIKKSIDDGFKGVREDLEKSYGKINNIYFSLGDLKSTLIMTKNGINDLNKKGISFSDLGIIAAVATVKDSVDKLKTVFDQRFGVVDTDSLMAHEGSFVRMIKRQFILLKELMASYFDMEDKESSLYKIRYSIVSGFGELEKVLKTLAEDILGIRSFMSTISSFVETGNKRLEMIYDYLKTMKLSVNLGDSVNSTGSSLWDVLKALIEALGSILTAVVNGLADVLDSIASLVGKMLDMLIKLFVPDNLDFMNKKFESTGEGFKAKFSFVFGWIDVFKGLFSNQRNLEDITISFGGMFAGGVNLPLSKISEFAPLVRAVITGFILLEFLIDMYKWFHTRGEIIE